jgi:hypothetical protein
MTWARSSAVPRDAEFGVDQAALDRPGDEAIDESAGARSIRQPGVEVLLLRVADGEFIASRQGAVLDQQTADVVACAICSRQLVEFLVGDARCDGKILEEGRDVSLPDPVTPLLDRFIDFNAAATGTSSAATTPVSGW